VIVKLDVRTDKCKEKGYPCEEERHTVLVPSTAFRAALRLSRSIARDEGRNFSSVYLVHERVGIKIWKMETRWRGRPWRDERERRAVASYRPGRRRGL